MAAPLDHIPLFVQGGSVIPTRKRAGKNLEETDAEDYEFIAFGVREEECRGLLYVDDGASREFEHGHFGLHTITVHGIQELLEGKGWQPSQGEKGN